MNLLLFKHNKMSINIKKDGKLVKITPTSYNELTDLPNIESSGDVTTLLTNC